MAFGRFANNAFRPKTQALINKLYVKLMGLDMSEFKKPDEYESLNKLFTRRLERPRAMPENEKAVVSGVDALVTDHGLIREGMAYQIKGMEYELDKLLGKYYEGASELLEWGEYVNLYLSPKDYHRYHMPFDLEVKSIAHIPGKLYPVNKPLLKKMPDLFIENERVVIEGRDKWGAIHFIVLVGALNVGKMVVSFEPEIQTNSEIREPKRYTYENLVIKRGEEFGWFEMGSTVLIFSEEDSWEPTVKRGDKVSFGEPIGRLTPENRKLFSKYTLQTIF